jgi:hypothetical protein
MLTPGNGCHLAWELKFPRRKMKAAKTKMDDPEPPEAVLKTLPVRRAICCHLRSPTLQNDCKSMKIL